MTEIRFSFEDRVYHFELRLRVQEKKSVEPNGLTVLPRKRALRL